ncbi:PsaA [Salmonella phage 19]|nr:PsaA [Salmonella phage 19]
MLCLVMTETILAASRFNTTVSMLYEVHTVTPSLSWDQYRSKRDVDRIIDLPFVNESVLTIAL